MKTIYKENNMVFHVGCDGVLGTWCKDGHLVSATCSTIEKAELALTQKLEAAKIAEEWRRAAKPIPKPPKPTNPESDEVRRARAVNILQNPHNYSRDAVARSKLLFTKTELKQWGFM